MTPTNAEIYDGLLHALAEHIGLDGDALVKTQELVIDDLSIGLACEGVEGVADVMYFANLGEPAPELVPEIYRTLLQANNMWAGTGGATLGLQVDTGNVILAGRIDLKAVTPIGLTAILDGFSDTAQFWKKCVTGELELSEVPSIPFGMRV